MIRFSLIGLLTSFLMLSSVYGQEESATEKVAETICDKDLALANEASHFVVDISEALAREDSVIRLSYLATAPIEEGQVQKARQTALYRAFRYLVELSSKQMVSEERLETVSGLFRSRILQKSRLFIRSFQTEEAGGCGEEYRMRLNVVLKANLLRKTLLKNRILDVEFVEKGVRVLNIKKSAQYEWVKTILSKRIRNLKRVVLSYQKKGEALFLVETSSSLDEMIERLKPFEKPGELSERLSSMIKLYRLHETEPPPPFAIIKGDKGGLEITLL